MVSVQIDSLKSQVNDLKKQLDSLRSASEPSKDEVNRLKELKKIISAEEKEMDRLTQGSKQLKEKVITCLSVCPFPRTILVLVSSTTRCKNCFKIQYVMSSGIRTSE